MLEQTPALWTLNSNWLDLIKYPISGGIMVCDIQAGQFIVLPLISS